MPGQLKQRAQKRGAFGTTLEMVKDTAREITAVPQNIKRLYKEGKLGEAFNPKSPTSKKAMKARREYYKGKYK